MCFAFKIARVSGWILSDLPSLSTRVSSGMHGSEEPAGTHEKPDMSR